jgi:hypothetical protein
VLNRGRLLLGAFDDVERAVAFARRVAVIEADEVRELWGPARENFLGSPAPAPASPKPLDDETRKAVEEILAAPLFSSTLAQRPWSLSSLHIGSTVTLQPIINLDRVAVMRRRIEADGTLAILFPITTAIDVEREVADGPIVSFISSRGELEVSGAEINRLTDTAPIELTFRIEPRPNYVSVLDASGRYILRNGHHRLIAASNSGACQIPMVVVRGSVDALADRIDGLPLAKDGRRAGTLADFLPHSLAAVDVLLKPKRYALRLHVERETLYATAREQDASLPMLKEPQTLSESVAGGEYV